MAYKLNGFRAAAVVALFGVTGVFAACSSDNNNNTPSTDGGTGGKNGGTGGKNGGTGGSGMKTDGGTGGKNGGTGGKNGGTGGEVSDSGTGGTTSAESGAGGTTGTGGTPEGGCEGPSGCYNCDPTKTDDSVQFLNHCTDNSCVPFPGQKDLPSPLPKLPGT